MVELRREFVHTVKLIPNFEISPRRLQSKMFNLNLVVLIKLGLSRYIVYVLSS